MGVVLAIAGVVLIAAMTLTPDRSSRPLPIRWCLLCGDMGALDFTLNVMLFVPFALGMRLAGVGRVRVLVIALVMTITIEAVQFAFIYGRDASLGDVVANTLGGVVGVVLAERWRTVLVPDARAARILAACYGVIWVAGLAASAAAVRTSLPRTTLWGQWQPELLNFDRFTGRLLEATVAGVSFPDGVMGDSPAFRQRLLSDSVVVRVRVTPGEPTQRPAPIASVYDEFRTPIFLLAQRGRDLTFSLRARASDARLRNPAVELADVFPDSATRTPADTLTLLAGITRHRLWVRAVEGGRVREHAVALDASLAWSFFLPFDYALDDAAAWLSGLWLAGTLLPLAYWAARAGARVWLGVAAAALLALLVVPLAMHVHPTAPGEAAAALAGIAAGAVLARLSERAAHG